MCTMLFKLTFKFAHVTCAGSVVLKGTYLSQHKLVKHGIHFVDYQPNNKVLQYSHHVIATSIFLHPVKHKGGRRKWRLDIEDHERILNVLHERVEPLGTT